MKVEISLDDTIMKLVKNALKCAKPRDNALNYNQYEKDVIQILEEDLKGENEK